MLGLKQPQVNAPLFYTLLVLLVFVILSTLTGLGVFAWGARLTFLLLAVLGLSVWSVRENLLLFASLGLVVWVLLTKGSFAVILTALDLAAFFAAFISTLTIMRDVAAVSRSILSVGKYLTSQPPGRRFYATAIGTHFLGVFLNFSAVSLMSPMIQESARTATGEKDLKLERRQLNALIRGFAWVLLWAPTTLSQAVLLTIFTEVSWSDIGFLGMATGAGFVILGRLYDRFEWRKDKRPTASEKPLMPWGALLVVCLICALLIGSTLLASYLTGATIALVLMCVTPIITLSWFLMQSPPRSWSAAQARIQKLNRLLQHSTPVLARSAIALGLSGFLGRCLGQVLPIDLIAQSLNLSHMPGWLFLAALPIFISLGGQIALSPILLVVLLGEVLAGVDVLPTGQVQIVFALTVGWALSMTTAPNATATLLIAANTKIPPTRLTWHWNLRYGLLCYAVAIVIFAFIA